VRRKDALVAKVYTEGDWEFQWQVQVTLEISIQIEDLRDTLAKIDIQTQREDEVQWCYGGGGGLEFNVIEIYNNYWKYEFWI
jgi:hypothetical protein